MGGPVPFISTEPIPCKICQAPARPFGVADLNRSCADRPLPTLPITGVPIYYHRCAACGFVFTTAFDDWSDDDFARHVYNEDYVLIDPDYVERRPKAHAGIIAAMFAEHRDGLAVLDYGGGNGLLARTLEAHGFAIAQTYDPFGAGRNEKPDRRFDMVTCFEAMEHATDPDALVQSLAGLVEENGIILFSTLTQTAEFHAWGMAWWYIAPRNGHVSIFSPGALQRVWGRHGFALGSFDDGWHVAFREMPDFARHLLGGRR